MSDLHFLGYPDGRVEATIGLRRDLARVIRQVRPDRVLCPTPERNYIRMPPSHPDHRAVGSAALDAIYPDARNPFAFPELRRRGAGGLDRPRGLDGRLTPNHYVDVTGTFDRKVAALRAHKSQTGQMDNLDDFLRGWLARNAEQAGWPEGKLAEAFQVMDTG